MTAILVVDDDPHDLHAAAEHLMSIANTEVCTCVGGEEALEQLPKSPAMLVVTDLHMPGMDGLELLRQIRKDHPLSPVVVMTRHGSEDAAAQALNEGASGYVPKRRMNEELVSVVQKVLRSVAARGKQQRIEEVLDYTVTRFVVDNDIGMVQPIVGYLQEKIARLLILEQNELLRVGLAIQEAITNAIYHGNLEVGSDLKEKHIDRFQQVAARRAVQHPYGSRRVHITSEVSRHEFVCSIRDEGPGFDVHSVPDPLSSENLGKPSGRGLLLIRRFMDQIVHNEIGNEVTMVKRLATASMV